MLQAAQYKIFKKYRYRLCSGNIALNIQYNIVVAKVATVLEIEQIEHFVDATRYENENMESLTADVEQTRTTYTPAQLTIKD